MDGKILGKKIKQARQNQGWTQVMLSERSGVAQGIITQYESGNKVRPDTDIINRLAKALNISSDFLLAEEKDKFAHIPPQIKLWLENPDSVPYLKKAYNEFKE